MTSRSPMTTVTYLGVDVSKTHLDVADAQSSRRCLNHPRAIAALLQSLPAGTHTITIESAKGENDGIEGAVSENLMARCVYPDGYTKSHQVKTVEDLAARVIVVLRSHFGVEGDIHIASLPESLSAGQSLTVEI